MRSKSKTTFIFNITTVEGQEQQYLALDVSRAKAARKLQETMRFISERAMLYMIDNHLIIGSKLRRRGVIISEIYGDSTDVMQGKTVRETEKHIREDATIDMLVNRLAFLWPSLASSDPNYRNRMDERTSDAIYCSRFSVEKMSTGQLLHMHMNRGRTAHISDAIVNQVEYIAVNENMPTCLIFGDRYGNTTILDYYTDPDNERDDDISDGEHSDDSKELEDNQSMSSFLSVGEGELEDHIEVDDVENQGDHFTHADNNSGESEYEDDSGENTSDGDESDENPGVGDQEENRRPNRNRQEPERLADLEHSPTFSQASLSFFQAVTQYQNIDATMSTKQYGMKAGLKMFGDAGRNAVASEIRHNLHDRSL